MNSDLPDKHLNHEQTRLKLEEMATSLVSDSQLLQGQLTHLTKNLNTFQQLLAALPQVALQEMPDQSQQHEELQEEFQQEKPLKPMRESVQQRRQRTQYAARREQTPKNPTPEKKASDQWEMALGVRWLSRLGILAVLIGIAIAFAYAFPSFTAPMKLLAGVVLSIGMFFAGHRLQKSSSQKSSSQNSSSRENPSPTLAMVLKGGSFAVGYLTLFAMFFIPEVQLIQSLPAGIATLMVYNGLMLLYAHKAQSQTIASLALVFGYYTASYSGSEDIALMAAAVLSVTAVILSVLNPHWKTVARLSCLQALITVCYWEIQRPSGQFLHVSDAFTLSPQIVFTYLWANFLLFQFAGCCGMKGGDKALTMISVFGTYGLFHWIHCPNGFHLGSPDFAPPGVLELIMGSIQGVYLILMKKLESLKEAKENLYSLIQTLGVSFVAMATISYFEGNQILPALLAAEAMALGVLSLKDNRKGVYYIAAQLLWIVSFFGALPWKVQPDSGMAFTQLLSPLWVAFTGFLLDHFALRAKGASYKGLFSILASTGFFFTVNAYVQSGWVTFAEALCGIILILQGFKLQTPIHRRLGLLWFAMAGLHLVFYDMGGLGTPQKILAFVGLGLAMLGASYGYSKLLVQTKAPLEAMNNPAPTEASNTHFE
ncbi:MAG: DUF2339 domain-containing protein [Cyanobacteria bacterium]|nr:DUF2339 domain-containing protein [Cyanobacteriota bacterium]